MATSSGSIVPNTLSGINNYTRVLLAVNNELPNILRELLLIKEPTYLLDQHIINNYLSRNLVAEEWLLIRSVKTHMYNDFDLALMYKIIRALNIVPSPTNGWGSRPKETEVTLGDDIERIRRIRNEFLHRGNTTIPDNELANYFSTFKDIASRFEIYLNKTNREFVSKIENVEKCVTYSTEMKELMNLELLRVNQYFNMPAIVKHEQIDRREIQEMLHRSNRENLLICDICSFGIVNSFCTTCKKYFCKMCFKQKHISPLHQQVYIQQSLDPKNIEVRCNRHELCLNMFCVDDDQPICAECLLGDHQTCAISSLENAVKAIDLNNRQSKLYSSFQNFISEIDETKETVFRDLSSIEEKRLIFFADTEKFEQQISTKVSCIKEDAMGQIVSHERKMEAVISEINERKVKVMEMVDEFHHLIGISSKTERLVYIYKLEHLLKINHKNFVKMLKRESIATIDPKFRDNLEELHSAIIDLGLRPIRGQLFLNKCNIKLTKILSFKLKEKTNPSFIRGCALLPNNNLCFTDDTEGLCVRYSSGVIKAYALPCSPVDIAYVGENRIAVSLRKRRSVGIITLNENEKEEIQSKEYTFKDIGSIRSLAYDGEHIIVQISSFGFYKIDHKGNIIKRVSINDEINIQYVSCRNDKIYYTKWDTNTVICCDQKGKVLWDFQDSKILKSPIGIAVDEKENVFVTGLYSNNVIVISQCGKYGEQLFSHSENKNQHYVVDYNIISKQLLVCSSSGDTVLYLVDTTNIIE